ncbi:MAG: Acyl-CoA dehydrogenase [Actinomycetia bacterium]|nr:Acyl-CoA dehydrogenase [Actinomycetes bacterium]MDQ1655139.1 3-oxo-4-pregnene-20-carboxyl-CoA dehydrogenase alpha subunit [Cryptosporangiaceae bacterium]
MLFDLDETQQAIAQLAGHVLDSAVLDRTGADPPEHAWKALAQAGLLALAVPEWLGGDGLGVTEIGVLLTEAGRRAVPVPALATLALGVLPVARWGSRDQQRDLLAGVMTGETVLTAAVRHPPALPASASGAVTGSAVGVPYAEQAHRVLVPVALGTGGTAIALVDPRADGVTLTRTPSSSGSPEYTLRMDAVRADGFLAGARAGDLYGYAVAGACAAGDGLLAGALALTAAHTGSREQFGRPLAAFQAVAQQIADVYVASRTLHLATLAACWHMSASDLAVAAYWLTEEAPAALRTCHHLHGGIGLDVTYPLHRFSSQVKDLSRLLGGAEHCVERLCSSI